MRISRIRNAILILALCLLLLGAVRVQAAGLSGSGTQEDPYLIKTAADLASVHDDLSAHYALDADIDLFGRIFEPIGNGAEGAFTGSLDGRGHTIRGLELDLQDSKYVGLFGYLEGSVSNLKLSEVNIVGGRYVGAVAGNIGLGGSVTDCSVLSGSVTSYESAVSAYVGGITGLCEGTLNKCSNAAAVAKTSRNDSAYDYVGGLAGSVTDALELIGSSNSGAVSGTNSSACIGGLIGSTAKKVRMQECSNTGEVRYGSYIGGLIGSASGTVELHGCSNTGMIAGFASYSRNAAGLIGETVTDARFQNCSNAGEVINGMRSGGLVGYAADTVEMRSCSNAGRIAPYKNAYADSAAGLIAEAAKNVVIEECTNTGDIVGHSGAGGMIEECKGTASITDCTNTGDISCSISVGSTGGIAGYLSNMELRNCRNEGSISAPDCAAGIVGGGVGNIFGCSNYGNVYGENNSYYGYKAAGILANTGGTTVVDGCSNYGNIAGYTRKAIVANLNSGTLLVKNCRNYGEADSFSSASSTAGNLNYGDLLHDFGADVSISSVESGNAVASISPASGIFLNGKTIVYCSDLRYARGGWGYSLSELQNPTSSAYIGWSLPGDWVVPEGKNSGLPLPKEVENADLMDESVLILEKGKSKTLNAPFEASKWDASSSIVRCTGGTVTAQNMGSAVVTAYDGTGRQANCVVFVYEKRGSLSLPESYLISASTCVQLKTDLPDDDPQGIIWSSSDPSVASVEQNGAVTGKKPGQAVITAQLPLSGVSASCTVTVQGQAVTTIKLSQTSASLQCGKTLTLTYTTGSQYDDKTVTWSSSSDAVATVENGVVTGQAPGVAVITCRAASGVSASCTVTVTQPSVSLTLDRDTLTMELGTTERLTAAILPENTTDPVRWSSTNSSVVSVDGSGTLTAKGVGQAAVYAYTASGLKASCSVTVYNKNIWPETVTLSQRVLSTRVGQQIQLQAEITPADCSHTALKWESSDPTVADVTVTGLVQTLGTGTAEIRVTTENGLFDVCTVKVSETSSAEFVVESGRVPKNGTADTAVYLTKNPGISAFSISVKYDAEKLEPIVLQPGALLASVGTLSSDVGDMTEPGTLHVTWYSDTDVTADGVLFTVTWQAIAPDGSTTEIDLSYTEDDICNSQKVNVPVRKEAGRLQLADYLIGDIYTDNEVNMKDIVYFARWFNKLETMSAQQEKAADVFYDQKLDVKDLTALAQLLSRTITPNTASRMSAVSAYSAAPEIFRLSVSDAAVGQNGEAALTIRGRNCPGIAALRFKLELPADCEVASVTPGELLDGGTFAYNEESRIVTWYANKDHVLNGDLLTVCVKVGKAYPEEAEVRISYQQSDYFHAGTYEPVPVATESGMILNGTGFTVTGAQKEGDSIKLTVKNAVTREVRIIVADYDANGKLLNTTVQVRTVTAGDSTSIVLTHSAAGAYSMVFFLDASRNAPLCGKTILKA